MNTLTALLTHRRFLVRAAAGTSVGTVLFFGVWAASRAWLPEGFYLHLPMPSVTNCEQGTTQTLRVFVWNLIFTGGLTALASLFTLNRFPLGYLVPWITFAIYGGLLGTNSWACPNSDGALAPTLAVLWTRAGFREIVGYVLIAAALANRYLWRQPSFFSLRVEQVRSLKEIRPSLDTLLELGTAGFLIAWGAVVEMVP